MSRLGRLSIATAATLVALAVPVAAHAATYTVSPGEGACGGADLACGGLVEAAAIAVAGDVFNLAPGTYPAPTFTTGGVTINGQVGVAIDGTIEFAGNAGGPSVLSKVAVSQGTSAAPGVYVSGRSGLLLSDAVVVSRDGFGVLISAGASTIERSLVATGGQGTGAIQVESGPGTGGQTSPPKSLTVDSTIAYGGGAGIRAITRNNEAEALAGNGAGDITLALRHVTAAGSTNGIDIDSSNALSLLGLNGDVGNIEATVTDSIAFNNRVVNYSGTLGLPLLGENTATLARTRTLESGDLNAIFVDPAAANYRLRPGSPAIGQGGVTPGESPTDIDGDDRSVPPNDLGADEFVAGPPPAAAPPTPPAAAANDGSPPAVVIRRPTANQSIKLTTTTTRTRTVVRNGKRVRVRTRTTRRTPIGLSGTAADPSGVKGVLLTIEKIGTTKPRGRCHWFNASKGIVLRSCSNPVLLLARLASNGTWTFNVRSTIRLSPGRYRAIAVGADNSGAVGNSAPRSSAIRTFRLTR